MLTRPGGRWHVSTVMNLLDRLGSESAQSRVMTPLDTQTLTPIRWRPIDERLSKLAVAMHRLAAQAALKPTERAIVVASGRGKAT
jgi:hypothetical protein